MGPSNNYSGGGSERVRLRQSSLLACRFHRLGVMTTYVGGGIAWSQLTAWLPRLEISPQHDSEDHRPWIRMCSPAMLAVAANCEIPWKV